MELPSVNSMMLSISRLNGTPSGTRHSDFVSAHSPRPCAALGGRRRSRRNDCGFVLAHVEDSHEHRERARNRRHEEYVAQRHAQLPKADHRDERADHGASMVGGPVQAESAATKLRRDGRGQQAIASARREFPSPCGRRDGSPAPAPVIPTMAIIGRMTDEIA